jgi:hypothetical protein
MKAIIADAQKHTNDSTNIQLEQADDDNSNINTSKEIEKIPGEDGKGNINDYNKSRVPVAPIHVPEKPFFESHPSVKKNALTSHSSSVEKPNPTPVKTKIIKPQVSKPAQKVKEKPKAVMPPKTEY